MILSVSKLLIETRAAPRFVIMYVIVGTFYSQVYFHSQAAVSFLFDDSFLPLSILFLSSTSFCYGKQVLSISAVIRGEGLIS